MARLAEDLEGFNATVDLVMGVLARHNGEAITNDADLPVAPLPRLKRGKKRANKASRPLLKMIRR